MVKYGPKQSAQSHTPELRPTQTLDRFLSRPESPAQIMLGTTSALADTHSEVRDTPQSFMPTPSTEMSAPVTVDILDNKLQALLQDLTSNVSRVMGKLAPTSTLFLIHLVNFLATKLIRPRRKLFLYIFPPTLLTTLQNNFPYHWCSVSLKYLGVHLTASYSTLYQANFPSLISETHGLFHKWAECPLSRLDRINVLKMAILPKFLYLFETLPIALPMLQLQNI